MTKLLCALKVEVKIAFRLGLGGLLYHLKCIVLCAVCYVPTKIEI